MDQTIKSLWVDALRSGKYKQGRNFLKTDDGFCCLGVLCDLHSASKPVITWARTGNEYSYANNTKLPPKFVYEWAGLNGNDGRLDKPIYMSTLMNMNDHMGRSFNDIAYFIQMNF